jgi:hypothetical protein
MNYFVNKLFKFVRYSVASYIDNFGLLIIKFIFKYIVFNYNNNIITFSKKIRFLGIIGCVWNIILI